MEDLTELRAALKQLLRALETERECVARIIRVIEKQMETEQPIPAAVSIMQRSINDRNNVPT